MTVNPHSASSRTILFIAVVLLLIHGILELMSIFTFFFELDVHFTFEELNQSWQAVSIIGILVGLLRVFAAVGILLNRMWAWLLGILISTATFAMLTFYLPAGAMDAILAGGVLLALLIGKYQNQPIWEKSI
jgi:hypothetical protein